MKYVLIVICALSLIFAGVAVGQNTPRFEHIYTQWVDAGPWNTCFEVYHDTNTGQEIVCIGGKSCYLTGRKW